MRYHEKSLIFMTVRAKNYNLFLCLKTIIVMNLSDTKVKSACDLHMAAFLSKWPPFCLLTVTWSDDYVAILSQNYR